MSKRKSWSPYKERVIAYVARNPGCCKWDVARYCTWNRQRNPGKQYYIVNTAIRNGWIIAINEGNRYALYLPEDVPTVPPGGEHYRNLLAPS